MEQISFIHIRLHLHLFNSDALTAGLTTRLPYNNSYYSITDEQCDPAEEAVTDLPTKKHSLIHKV